jgi:hypothetical protein
MEILNQAIGELVALFAFFAFPASQYLLLKTLSRKEGQPELWYLPDYGFRLVIRNLPRKRVLTDIRYRAFIRQTTGPSGGASVASIMAEPLIERDDMVLFPGTDQILLGFNIYQDADGIRDGYVVLVRGSEPDVSAIKVGASDCLVCDYSATIQNFFNFDVQVGKRIEVDGISLFSMLVQAQVAKIEQQFPLERIRNFQ